MIVVDTGPLLAAFDATDEHHETARSIFLDNRGPFVLSPFVLAEVDYLVSTRLGADAAVRILESLAAAPFAMADIDQGFIGDCLDLLRQKAYSGIGLTDASLIAMAIGINAEGIATFDRRHFHALPKRRGTPLRLFP